MEGEITTIRDLAIAVKQVLSSPDKWCKGGLAQDANGYQVPLESSEAVSFCIAGAAQKVLAANGLLGGDCAPPLFSLYQDFFNEMRQTQHGKWVSISQFNDHKDTTFEDVHTKLDEIITKYA